MKRSKILIVTSVLLSFVLYTERASATPTNTLKEIQDKQTEVSKIADDTSNLEIKIAELNTKIENNESDLIKKKEEITKKESELAKKKENVKETARSIQVNKSIEPSLLDILVSSKNMSDFVSNVVNSKQLTSAKTDSLNDTVKEKTELDELKTNLETATTQLEKDKQEAEKSLAEMQEKKATTEDLISNLNNQYGEELAKQEKEAKSSSESILKNIELPKETKEENNQDSTIKSDSSIVGIAQKYLGIPYSFGGSSPATGFDCSGFVSYVYAEAGKSIPRQSGAISTAGTYIELSSLEAGDIVVWGGVGSAYHVGIYIGNGTYIHSPVPGDVVKVASMQSFTPSFGVRI